MFHGISAKLRPSLKIKIYCLVMWLRAYAYFSFLKVLGVQLQALLALFQVYIYVCFKQKVEYIFSVHSRNQK